jgi:hypothetical protein
MYQLTQPGAGRLVMFLALVAFVCALLYGLVTGSFSMGQQLWAAPLKVALGLFLSVLICLPSLYIFACLSGAERRLSQIVGLASGMAMLMMILLVGFAPVAWLFSQSTESIAAMGALHLLFLLIALAFGTRFLGSALRQSRARSLAAVSTWSLIFVLVVLQMTTTLRPLVGTADTFLPKEKKFFLRHWADNMSPRSSEGLEATR